MSSSMLTKEIVHFFNHAFVLLPKAFPETRICFLRLNDFFPDRLYAGPNLKHHSLCFHSLKLDYSLTGFYKEVRELRYL